MTEPADDTQLSMDALPRHTTPTWEVELLISGVAVFAMLQLPGWLDDRFFALRPRFGQGWELPLFLTYVYLKSAAVILSITFALHLLLRAQWIAQVGMHSVFPAGIQWDRMRIGPVQREVEQTRYGNADIAIDRADNRATIVFAYGVMLASMLLLVCLLFAVVFALALGLLRLTGLEIDIGNVFTASVMLAVLPAVLAGQFDRHFGARLRRGGMPRRLLARLLTTYSRLGLMSRSSNPVFSLISSQGGERRAIFVTTATIAITILAVMISTRSMQSPLRFGDYGVFPVFADGSATIDSAHYDDQREPGRDHAGAYIQSAIATGPYLRLTVPYRPDEDGTVLRNACPAAQSGKPAARAVAALDCLRRLHAARLDGAPLPDLQYDTGTDPRTDRPALVAMIDIRRLAPGRHVLEVAQPPLAKGESANANVPDRITFWR